MTTYTPQQNMTGSTRAISLDHTALIISSWRSHDVDVLASARAAHARGEDLNVWLTAVVRAGAIATSAAGSSADLARLEHAVAALTTSITTQVQTSLNNLQTAVAKAVDPERGDLANASQNAVSRLATGVAGLISGPNATVPAVVQTAVKGTLDTALGEIRRALVDQQTAVNRAVSADRDSVTNLLSSQISTHNREIAELLSGLAATRTAAAVQTAAASSGPRKGQQYEESCEQMLTRLTAATDGGAASVATKPGLDGSRAGDLIVPPVSLGGTQSLVVECKNRPGSKLSIIDWRKSLHDALIARGATVAWA
jgi:hypothetical protein